MQTQKSYALRGSFKSSCRFATLSGIERSGSSHETCVRTCHLNNNQGPAHDYSDFACVNTYACVSILRRSPIKAKNLNL